MAIKQRSKSLKSRGADLADSFFQLNVLNQKEQYDSGMSTFQEKI